MIDDEGDKKSSIYPCFTYPSCHRENVGYTQEESNFLSLFVYSLCVGVSIQPDVDVEAKMPNYLCCSTTSTFWIETSVADISFSGWSPSLQSYSHLQEADDFSQTTPLKKNKKTLVLSTPPPAHHQYIRPLQNHQTISVGGMTQSCAESLRCTRWTGMEIAQFPVEFMYHTSPNQTEHRPVSHIAARLSVSQRSEMVDIITDLFSLSSSQW